MATTAEFESFLQGVCDELTEAIRADKTLRDSSVFEDAVRLTLERRSAGTPFQLDADYGAQGFPDFTLGEFGVEVKFVRADSWRSVGNSVFEGHRRAKVEHIYVLYGKVGGTPEVRFARYDDCIVHVRTSHVPRFEVDVTAETSTLFATLGTTYEEFSKLADEGKMKYIRKYARSRLKSGERLWWLGDADDSQHTVPIAARIYTTLSNEEKKQMRAEAALLSPQIVGPKYGAKDKYADVALFLITYRGVLAYNARDLFSAGSVALRADETRGGNYLLRALQDIEAEMRMAALTLPTALFEEYWGESPPPNTRIKRWLEKADGYAKDWTPSKELFQP